MNKAELLRASIKKLKSKKMIKEQEKFKEKPKIPVHGIEHITHKHKEFENEEQKVQHRIEAKKEITDYITKSVEKFNVYKKIPKYLVDGKTKEKNIISHFTAVSDSAAFQNEITKLEVLNIKKQQIIVHNRKRLKLLCNSLDSFFLTLHFP